MLVFLQEVWSALDDESDGLEYVDDPHTVNELTEIADESDALESSDCGDPPAGIIIGDNNSSGVFWKKPPKSMTKAQSTHVRGKENVGAHDGEK